MMEDSSMYSKFCVRFQLPYPNYLDLLQWICNDSQFTQWCKENKNRKKSSPIEMVVLGLLQYLGHGWTVDDIKEQTAISKEVHEQVFHCLMDFCSTTLYS